MFEELLIMNQISLHKILMIPSSSKPSQVQRTLVEEAAKTLIMAFSRYYPPFFHVSFDPIMADFILSFLDINTFVTSGQHTLSSKITYNKSINL